MRASFFICLKMRSRHISELLKASNAVQMLKLLCLFERPLFQMCDLGCGKTLFYAVLLSAVLKGVEIFVRKMAVLLNKVVCKMHCKKLKLFLMHGYGFIIQTYLF